MSAHSFFFQAEDGIRDGHVTGVQTCALPISAIDIQPEWSPDGSKIVFTSNRDGLFNTEIYVMNANGSGVTRLTFNPAIDDSPDWSPDGMKIVFASNRTGLLDFEIWVENANGANPVRLTNGPRASVRPSWSPDGAQI